MGVMLEKVAEVERAAGEKAWKERGCEQKGLIETDFNPSGDIRKSYIWGMPGGGNLEWEKERETERVGGYICKSF